MAVVLEEVVVREAEEVLEAEARLSPLAGEEAGVGCRLLVEGEVLQERSTAAVEVEAGRSTLVVEEASVRRLEAEVAGEVPKRQVEEARREHLRRAMEEVRGLWMASSARPPAVMTGEVEAARLQLVFWEARAVQAQVLLSSVLVRVVEEAWGHGLAAVEERLSALQMAEAHQISALALSYLRQEPSMVVVEVGVQGQKPARVYQLRAAAEVLGTWVLAVKVRVEGRRVIRPSSQTFSVRVEVVASRLVARLVEEEVP